jgi:hypothetical protein
MIRSKRVLAILLAAVAVLCVSEIGERMSIPGVRSLVTPAEAIVGRPLTPVSVAGVGRRTVRRCAAHVYHC